MMSREVMTIRPMVIDRGGGACEESQAPFFVSPFRKGAKGNVLFFGAKKRTKRNIHLTQALPYMEGM